MTTATFSTVVDHSTDAAFRTWGLELNTQIASTVTMVQTADTGQINWTTATRAGTNAEAGYEIWKLNDSLFGTAPVYFRIGYGTGGATTAPRIQVTVGTGTNGAGTLTGTALTIARTINASGSSPTSTVTAYASFMCATDGYFGFTWKGGTSNTQNANRGSFEFHRSVDTAGAFSVQGGMVFWGSGATGSYTALQNLRFAATAAAYTVVVAVPSIPCVIPGAVTSSTVGSNFQAYIHFTALPDEIPIVGVCTVLISEVAVGTTFTVALVAGVSRTYIQMGQIAACETTGGATYGRGMLWQ